MTVSRYAAVCSALVVGLGLVGPAHAADEGLVAHLTFDEGAGEIARDLTGNGHDGTINGPVYVKSPRGYALAFDGVDDIVTYGNLESMILTGDMTLMVWVKTKGSEAPDTHRLIFGDGGGGVQRNLNLRLSSYGQLVFEWADGTRNAYLTADAGLLDGSWKHVTVVCDSGALEAALYVDGEQVSRMRMPLPISKAPTPQRLSGMWAHGCLKGELDEIRLYSRALAQAEIRALYEQQAVVEVGRPRLGLEMADGVLRAATYATVRNWTEETKQARLERHVTGKDGREEVTAESVTLPPRGSQDVLLGYADLQPLFKSRTDLYLVQPPSETVRAVVALEHEGAADVQELTPAARPYVEAMRLLVENPWQRRLAEGKTSSVVMEVETSVAPSELARGRLVVTLAARSTGEVLARREVAAPEPTTRVTLDARQLPWSAYEVRAAIVDGNGRELAATMGLATVLPDGPQRIEVLNNLVSELANARARGSLDSREIAFMNPRDGWCFFSLAGRASLRLDESREALLFSEGDGQAVEAMRLLPAGRHTLHVTGDPTDLIVRAIPALVHNVYPTSPGIAPFGPHTWERLSRYTLPNCNMIESHKADIPEAAEWVGQGKSWIMNRTAPGLTRDREWSAAEMLEFWRSTPGWGTKTMSGIQVDEYGPGFGNANLMATVQSAALLAEDPEFAGRAWIPFVGAMYGTDIAELFMKTTLAAGWPFSIERYLGEMPTEAEDRQHIEAAMLGVAEGWEAALPGSLRQAIFTLMYSYLPYCTTNRCPTADFRAHLEMQMQVLANDPGFFGLWGVQPYRSNYVDEEILNWMGALLRHYCIEGRTEPLLKDPYELKHVTDPDFEQGTTHWQVAPAEEGTITPGRHAGYGVLEGRYPSAAYGDTFLVLRRSAVKPNAFSQEIQGLEPGRLYSMKMITGDYQDLLAGKSRETTNVVSIGIEGAEVLEGAFQDPFYSARGPQPFSRENPYHMNYHWLQFRARGATARLTVTDWQDEQTPGGPVGQELMCNFIEIQPVFEAQ